MGSLSVDLDRTSPIPLYHQLAQQLQGAIETGALTPGCRLGNEILLAQRLGVSRPTMRRAIQMLVGKGLLVRKRGIGTQVVQGPITRPVQLTSLFDDLTKGEQFPQTTVLVNQIVPASEEVATTLRVPRGQPVLHLRRLRSARHEPLAILENYLPNDLVDIGDSELSSVGLYQAMRAAGVRMPMATQRIGAREGTPDECRLLDEPPHSPLLTMDRRTVDDSGRPIEWGRHVYRPSRYVFTITLVR